MATAPGPLHGLRVLDLSSQLSGPYGTMILGDLGADVVKVERPGEGDDGRKMGPLVAGESAINGEEDGRPLPLPLPVSDIGTGMFAAIGILAALAHRTRTGEGQAVDASLLDTPIAWSVDEAAFHFATGEVPPRLGPGHRTQAPYQAFRTADGWVNLGGGSPTFWPVICRVRGVPHLVEDPRFATPMLRVRNRPALEALLQARFLTEATAVWLERLETAGVPAGPVLTYDQVFADPHVRHREMAVEVEHPRAGRTRVLGIPIKLSATPGRIRRPAPVLGEHTDEILAELGYDAAAIGELHRRKIV